MYNFKSNSNVILKIAQIPFLSQGIYSQWAHHVPAPEAFHLPPSGLPRTAKVTTTLTLTPSSNFHGFGLYITGIVNIPASLVSFSQIMFLRVIHVVSCSCLFTEHEVECKISLCPICWMPSSLILFFGIGSWSSSTGKVVCGQHLAESELN